jgi:hypothetical protein
MPRPSESYDASQPNGCGATICDAATSSDYLLEPPCETWFGAEVVPFGHWLRPLAADLTAASNDPLVRIYG